MAKEYEPPEIVTPPVTKPTYPLVAGEGGFHVYSIPSSLASNGTPLTPGIHYLGIDAVSWFVNKQSNWFSNHMATGILQIALSNGIEQYQAALGTFGLSGGAKVAPVFSAPVLNERNYVGGSIKITATISDIRKDKELALMLKSAADASLGIVSGMVTTATLAGPAAILGSAGSSLISSIKSILSSTATQSKPIFSDSGIVIDIDPATLFAPESYLLFHRGSDLIETNLALKKSGIITLPQYEQKELTDGAWLLLRIFIKTAYSGVREWYSDVRKFKASINDLVMKFQNGVLSKDSALGQLTSFTSANKTLLDELFRLSSLISSDGVITLGEAMTRISELNQCLNDAKNKITGVPATIPAPVPAPAPPSPATISSFSAKPVSASYSAIKPDIQSLIVFRNIALMKNEGLNKTSLPKNDRVLASIEANINRLGIAEL